MDIMQSAFVGVTDDELDSTAERLERLFPESRRIFERAHQVVPGGFTRSRFFWPIPIYVRHGEGPYIWDVDDRQYVDNLMGFGVLILGHCHPAVVAALHAQVDQGTQFGTALEEEALLAELITGHVPGAETVLFVNSGTEATLAALRIAREATGRSKVAKFEGGWHGQNDYLQHSFSSIGGPVTQPEGRPDTLGIPPTVGDDLVVLPYNHESALEIISQEAGDLACVILEGVLGAGGALPAAPAFARQVQATCRDRNVVFILDEVITGFRFGLSGIAGQYGLEGDLTTLGKIIGGGLPIGAVTGRRDLLDLVRPNERDEQVVLAGTFSANPLSMSGGIAQLEFLIEHPEVYTHIDDLGERMRTGLSGVLDDLGIPGAITGAGSLWGLHLGVHDPPSSVRDSAGFRETGGLALAGYLLREGILMEAPIHLGFLSAAHTGELVKSTIEAHARALKDMVAAGFFRNARTSGEPAAT